MKLLGDLIITTEGQVRLFPAINHISFGFHQMVGEIVEYLNDINCYHIKLKQNESIQYSTVEKVVKMLNKIYGITNLSSILEKFQGKFQVFKNELEKYHQSLKHEIEEKTEKMNEFIQFCFDYIKNLDRQESNQNFSFAPFEIERSHQYIDQENKISKLQKNQSQNLQSDPYNFPHSLLYQYSSQSKSQSSDSASLNLNEQCTKTITQSKMFTYSIGKVNFNQDDFDILYQGYSAGYLEFLGLDKQSLISLTLRGKRIDLVKDKQDITNYSAFMLNEFNLNNPLSLKTFSNVVTFDGFPIKINQNIQKVDVPNKFVGPLELKTEYSLLVTSIDVDIGELENLMAYRQQLTRYPNSLPLDTLIQRELSYKFEDIEYSIHSEDFINKYYPIMKSKEEKSQRMSPCKYKLLKS